MQKIIGVLIVILSILGCDAIQDTKEMFEKQERLQKVIEDKYGWESQVAWNMQNGALTQVIITFNANDVRNEQVTTLETAALDAVKATFQSKPQSIYVRIALEEQIQE